MPSYDFRCRECGQVFEFEYQMSEVPAVVDHTHDSMPPIRRLCPSVMLDRVWAVPAMNVSRWKATIDKNMWPDDAREF